MVMQSTKETLMFGMTESAIRSHVAKWGNPAMSAISEMSDAQELLKAGQLEQARQTLNRAKFIVSEYLEAKPYGELAQYCFAMSKNNTLAKHTVYCTARSQRLAYQAVHAAYGKEFNITPCPLNIRPPHTIYGEIDAKDSE